MKILLIVDDYLPHSIKVAAKMMHELASDFQSKGHRVTVLTPSSDIKERIVEDEIDGIRVLLFRSGKIKNVNRIKRALNESLLSIRAYLALKSIDELDYGYDSIVYYSPSIFFGHLVQKLSKAWNAKSYLILRDIFPQWTIDNRILSKYSPFVLYFKFFEYVNYLSADYIGVMSPSNLEYFKKRFDNIEKFHVLYNWAEINNELINSNTYRKKLGLQNKVVFFYGGNIGQAQNMSRLIELAIRLKHRGEAHFLFVGKGDEVELILKKKNQYRLDNVTYLPPVNQVEYKQMLSEFDIGLFNLHPGHKTHNFPGKLLGYMAANKPFIGCVNKGNDLKEIVNDHKAGYIFDDAEFEKLVVAADYLIDSKELRMELGNNGKKLLKKLFSVDSATNQIEKSLLSSSNQ